MFACSLVKFWILIFTRRSLVTKSSNQGNLVRIDVDNNNDKVLSGNVLLLLIVKQICPSTILMVVNLKSNKAKALTLAAYENDVSLVVAKYEDLIERILSHNGQRWDEEITELFKVLHTAKDTQFVNAIESKEIEYLAGNFTDIHHLTSFAIAIYTNLKAKETWMAPDEKSVQIAALMMQLDLLQKNITSEKVGAAFATDANGQPAKAFQRVPLAEWHYKHTGCDHVTKDGKDCYWCNPHDSHKRDPKCTDG